MFTSENYYTVWRLLYNIAVHLSRLVTQVFNIHVVDIAQDETWLFVLGPVLCALILMNIFVSMFFVLSQLRTSVLLPIHKHPTLTHVGLHKHLHAHSSYYEFYLNNSLVISIRIKHTSTSITVSANA